jgi:hypothetical protein
MDAAMLQQEGFTPRERYESQWQQVEELYCPLVAVSRHDGTLGGSINAAEVGASARPRLQPFSGEVALPPAHSVLTFLAAPVKRGLYKAVHIHARMQHLPLHIAVQPPLPVWRQLGSSAGDPRASLSGATAAAAGRRASRAGVPGGSPPAPDTGSSAPPAEAILMHVEQAKPRVQLRLLAAGGSLVAGQEQWLGLVVAPERDALHNARLELSWPLAGPSPGALGELACLVPALRGTGPMFTNP